MRQRGSTPPGGRRVSFSGIGHQGMTRLGAFHFNTAPLRRTAPRSQAQVYAAETMRVAAAMTKMAYTFEIEEATAIASNGGLTWKDVFIAQLYGTHFTEIEIDGEIWRSRRIMAAEIQTLLDSISAEPGSILVRTANGWAALFIGTPNYALSVDPGTNLPNWLPPVGSAGPGGAGLGWQYLYMGVTTEANNLATIGEIFRFDKNMVVSRLGFVMKPTSSQQFRMGIAPFNTTTNKITADPVYTAGFTIAGDNTQRWAEAPFATPVACAAGQDYVLFVQRTDGTGTATLVLYFNTIGSNGPHIPERVRTNSAARCASKAPTTSDTWTRENGFFCMAFDYGDPP